MSKISQMKPLSRLIWIDLEMSGLEVARDTILEVAVIITDSRLNPIAEPQSWAVYQPDSVLDNMDKWNTETHGRTGLIERCRNSPHGMADTEKMVLRYLKKYVGKHISPICGNSVCQDRRFLAQYMPRLEDYFHYRNLDVSAIKIVTQLYAADLALRVRERKSENEDAHHSAIHDIHASIEELNIYLKEFFRLESADADPPR